MVTTKAKTSTNGHVNRIKDAIDKPAKNKVEQAKIKPLKLRTVEFEIVGDSPYMQARFSQKAMNKIMVTQQAGQQARSKKNREPRDYDDDFENAKHKMADGSCGIPAGAFRAALISACRTVGFAMTLAKLSIFVEADGLDVVDGTPLVRIQGTPEKSIMACRNSNGSCDLRSRPMWKKWSAKVRVRFDEDQFSLGDVANLMFRVGQQVGLGEGRNDSRESTGMGFGSFSVKWKK